jgi:hypothetical protein
VTTDPEDDTDAYFDDSEDDFVPKSDEYEGLDGEGSINK